MIASFSGSSRARRALLVGLLLIVAVSAVGCSGSYKLRPNYFWDSLLKPSPAIINGLWLTIVISIVAQVIGVVLGVFAAIGKMAKYGPFRWAANIYIWIFRGTPLLVQLAFFFYGFQSAGIVKWPGLVVGPIDILPEILAGIVILGVNEGAYMAEIVRAGIISVDPGQTEAAKSLGMTYGQTMRRIVLPQAARVIIPPLGNEFNNMLKTTSLLSILSIFELYNTFSNLSGSTYASFEFLGACAIWYLMLTTVWSFFQGWIERRLAKGTQQSSGGNSGPRSPGFAQRLMALRAPIEQ
ncbi:MAG TPA: amino acid ABC transporter permease [Candidatus Limnocylindrales bacterium]